MEAQLPTAPVAEIATATAKALLGVKWSPKPPRRRAANELADYRCERDAFIAELAQAIGGSVLVVEPNTTATSVVRPDMEATECPN